MDLHVAAVEATEEEREAVDAEVGRPDSGWDGGQYIPARDGRIAMTGHDQRAQRHRLLPALRAVQSRVGWISEGALNYVCVRLGVPPAEAYGVATFYALLSLTPRPRRVLHVCDDIACQCRGATEMIAALERAVGPSAEHAPDGHSVVLDPDGAIWLRSPCLGLCDQAPAALLQEAGNPASERSFGSVTVEELRGVLGGADGPTERPHPTLPQRGDPSLRLLARVDVVDPTSIDAYRSADGYEALRRAVDMGPDGIIREVLDSKLMGRGGAAFPTGRKWDAVAKQPARPHYLICNADESEPGTFKDRVLMEGDPFGLVEAMTIAGYATGCEQGYIYIRGEYPLATARLAQAIQQARSHGLLGGNVMGRGFAFDIEIRQGAGAYICGEETAIFNSIEGFRGEPRNKPPFPVQAGLFSKPTVVNNVETLANIPRIILEGGPAFAASGTEQSTGTKLFCVCGCVERPGVYEVPFGTTLRGVMALAGGARGGRPLQAILLGGAAGVFVRPDELDIPLTFEGTRAAKATLGSGVIVAFDDRMDMAAILVRIAAFFHDESCGQCVPCRVGTVRQEEALQRIVLRRPRGTVATEVALLDEIGQGMKDASICGLGQTAYSAVESAIKRLGMFATPAGAGGGA
jgi:NADH-quinone oxidoreductase subunit F